MNYYELEDNYKWIKSELESNLELTKNELI
jgi:hypothetical protein